MRAFSQMYMYLLQGLVVKYVLMLITPPSGLSHRAQSNTRLMLATRL